MSDPMLPPGDYIIRVHIDLNTQVHLFDKETHVEISYADRDPMLALIRAAKLMRSQKALSAPVR